MLDLGVPVGLGAHAFADPFRFAQRGLDLPVGENVALSEAVKRITPEGSAPVAHRIWVRPEFIRLDLWFAR